MLFQFLFPFFDGNKKEKRWKRLTRDQALSKIEELKKYLQALKPVDELLSDIKVSDKNSLDLTINIRQESILITLPVCNTEWTFEAWDIARQIIKKSNNEFYPYHGSEPKAEFGNVIELRCLCPSNYF